MKNLEIEVCGTESIRGLLRKFRAVGHFRVIACANRLYSMPESKYGIILSRSGFAV